VWAPTVTLHALIVGTHHCYSIFQRLSLKFYCSVISAPIHKPVGYPCVFRYIRSLQNPFRAGEHMYEGIFLEATISSSDNHELSSFTMAFPSRSRLSTPLSATETDVGLELPAYSLEAASETETSNLTSDSDALSPSPANAPEP
jgi:hypothetical protein